MFNRKEQYLSDVDQVLKSLASDSLEQIRPSRIIFSQDKVKSGLFTKIAFDVYRVDNDPYKDLWILEESEEGVHLVRASDSISDLEARGDWTAVSDYDRHNVTLNYKDVPIARFSSKEFNFSPEDIFTFKSALLSQAQEDTEFVKNVLAGQPSGKVEALVNSFPEFKKFI